MTVAFYNQAAQIYEEHKYDGSYEILNLAGTITLKESRPICHAHLVFGNSRGGAFGGHLRSGCRVFACELVITELLGEPLHRAFDKQTGLPLWD